MKNELIVFESKKRLENSSKINANIVKYYFSSKINEKNYCIKVFYS